MRIKKVAIYRMISPSGKVYVGQSIDVAQRRIKHKNLYCEMQPHLYNSLKKYGFDSHNFTILETLPNETTQDFLNEREHFYLEYYKSLGCTLLNSRGAGSRGAVSPESKQKMSKARIGKTPWNKGIKTGHIPANKGTSTSKRSYSFYKNGIPIIIYNLGSYCKEHNLRKSCMIELSTGSGFYGKKGKYLDYHTDRPIKTHKSNPIGEEHPNSIFSNNQVLTFRKMYETGMSIPELSKTYNVKPETMRKIIKRVNYKSI